MRGKHKRVKSEITNPKKVEAAKRVASGRAEPERKTKYEVRMNNYLRKEKSSEALSKEAIARLQPPPSTSSKSSALGSAKGAVHFVRHFSQLNTPDRR